MTLSKPWLDSSLGSSDDDVDVERQQVADRVLIFGAVEPAERVGAAGIGVAAAARSRAVSSVGRSSRIVARSSGRGSPIGGM